MSSMSANPNEKTATHYRLRKHVKDLAGDFARMKGMSKSAYAEEAINKQNEENLSKMKSLQKAVNYMNKSSKGRG